MENTKKQMMKMLKGYGEGLVRSVCEAYALNYEEVLKKVMGEEEEVKRGRPEKKAKRVVNKELVVEDVIMKGLMAEVAEEEKGVAEAEAVAEAVAEWSLSLQRQSHLIVVQSLKLKAELVEMVIQVQVQMAMVVAEVVAMVVL